MSMNDMLHAGRNIMDDIQRALAQNDFSHLEQDISGEVNEAFHPTGKQQGSFSSRRAARQGSYFAVRKVNRDTGLFRIIIGLFGIIFNGICIAGFLISLFASLYGIIGVIVFAFFLMVFARIYGSGRSAKRLVQEYYDYGMRLGSVEYFSIRDFANAVGVSEETMREQLQEMKSKGYLPYARFDDSGSTLILTDRAYKLYLQAKEEYQRKQRQTEARSWNFSSTKTEKTGEHTHSGEKPERTDAQSKEPANAEAQPEGEKASAQTSQMQQETYGPEVQKAIETGQAYIRHIREVNDMIPDTEEMSNKLYKLEDICNRIFERMKKHPESLSDLKKFMGYYLPTTQKLMDAYVEVYNQPDAGENIRETRQEIENSFDLVNKAFEKLLDGMYEETAWDISSDINVMKTMMEQDGLSDEGKICKDNENAREDLNHGRKEE